MRLLVDWRAPSPRLARLLAIGCPHCDDAPLSRLTRHDAGRGGWQVWLTCGDCDARLGGPLEHRAHPWMSLYPAWREGLGTALTPEEMRAPRPLTFGELALESLDPRHRVLEQFRDRIRASGFVNIAWDYTLAPGDLEYLADAFGVGGEYAVAGLADRTARLLRLEAHHAAMLAPFVVDGRIDWGRPIIASYAPWSSPND